LAKRKQPKDTPSGRPQLGESVEIPGAGVVVETGITQTLEENYMPYAMSVIVSRALPEIDGFKPAHRKLLYTMYDMGLLKGNRTKSANIVGATMHLNPHGDGAIYETMVRMARSNESLLVPFVDSKGNFGKAYSRDMAYAAHRYTEARLEPVCEELFRDIDKETVDFVPNYDATTVEPTLLPVTFPAILANNTLGIAVGMASNICSFNLAELCETTIELMRDESHDIRQTLPAPDFAGGGVLLYDDAELAGIYETGRGSVKERALWQYEKEGNRVEITQIPPTTTVETIMDRIADHVKDGRVKELNDMRDETDLGGLRLTLDLKRGQDPDRLMQKLFRITPLQDNFSANFNILISGMPRVMGVREILTEWIAFRVECVRRRVSHELAGKRKRLHLLQGLAAILLDIDKAIKIIRETEAEAEVLPNLMIGFGIDKAQAEYVAEIRLRNLNREYLLKRTDEIAGLEKDIADLEETLNSRARVRKLIIGELEQVRRKYGRPRRTEILYETEEDAGEDPPDALSDYPVTVFFTREGYFKKITPASLRMSGVQKLKEGDEIVLRRESGNAAEMLVFTTHRQVYKCRVGDFEDGKASVIGEYLPARLDMDEGEVPVGLVLTADYKGFMLFLFQSGKGAKIPLDSYATKQNRRKLINAYSDKAPLAWLDSFTGETELAIQTSAGRMLMVGTAQIPAKTTKHTAGVNVITLKKGQRIVEVRRAATLELRDPHRFRVRSLPAAGALLRTGDILEQTTLEDAPDENEAPREP
jgi:DNA gyrase subunit A